MSQTPPMIVIEQGWDRMETGMHVSHGEPNTNSECDMSVNYVTGDCSQSLRDLIKTSLQGLSNVQLM